MGDNEQIQSAGLTDRDLGTVGGGSIPGGNASRGGAKASGEASTSDGTVDDGGTTGGEQHGQRASSDVASNKIDKHAKGNLGGRNPGDSETSMGDRDPKRDAAEHREAQIADPMTSRDPSKISQRTPEDSDPKH